MGNRNHLNLEEKKLTLQSDLKKFQEIYHNKGGVNTSLQYLNQCDAVKVFIDNEGQWQAGYCVNAHPDMRYLEPFEDQLKKRILKDKDLNEQNMGEITQIWMNRIILLSQPTRERIYLSSVIDALKTGKEIIIGGSKVATVWKSYEQIIKNELYFGLVPFKTGIELGKIVYNSADNIKSILIQKFGLDIG